MNEWNALFVSGYLHSILFLLPLLGLYLGLSVRKVSLRSILGLHKILLLLSIVLPIGIVLISYNSVRETDATARIEESRAWIPALSAVDDSKSVGTEEVNVATPEGIHRVSVQDVLYYFANLIWLFSVLGLSIFILRYALQAVCLNKVRKVASVSTIQAKCRLIE